MHDVFNIWIARPSGFVFFARLQRCADGVYAWYEFAVFAQYVVNRFTHAGHVFHIHGNVGAVRYFHANVRDVGTQRTH